MIDILAAEVPEVQAHRFLKTIQSKSHFAELNPMGCRDARIDSKFIFQRRNRLASRESAKVNSHANTRHFDLMCLWGKITAGASEVAWFPW
jgi:hypothetical protein